MTPASEKSINKLIKLMDDGEEVRKFIRVKTYRFKRVLHKRKGDTNASKIR